VQPLPGREAPTTPEAREKWEADRAAAPRASVAELHALLDGALDFTIDKIKRWW
jgi:hypothetical protein